MRGSRGESAATRWVCGIVLVLMAAAPVDAQLSPTHHTDGWVLAAAHTPGLEGSIWRTDLWIARTEAEVRLVFCPADTDNTWAQEHEVMFGEGDRVVYIEDVVDHYLAIGGGSWTGAIHYTSTGPVQVWARVYSINADGSTSYGQMIEGIPTTEMSLNLGASDDAEQQHLYAVKHTADDRYRVNVGVVNPTPVEGVYWIQASAADGDCPAGGCGTYTVTVPPFSMVQRQDPFADWQDGAWSEVVIQVLCQTPGAGGFGYASVVDNATNDAFFVRGVRWEGCGGG